jgi:sphingosine kinase
MVDLDIGTESIRWIGDARFFLGFLRGVLSNKRQDMRLRLNVKEDDKVEMARRARQVAGEARGMEIGGGINPLDANSGSQGLISGDKETGAKKPNGSHTKLDDTEKERGVRVENLDGPLPAARALKVDDSWVVIESGAGGPSPVASKWTSTSSKAADERGGWVHGQGVMYT